MHGGPGPDVLVGLAGDDVLWGNRLPTGPSRGTDRIDGGAGSDTLTVNFAFGDGSVKFVKQSINPNIYRALFTRAGGEVLSADSY